MFIHRSELVQQNPGPNDTVLLIDDFSGTGKQASEAWSEVFEELLTGQPRVFLVLVAATTRAISQVRENTGMAVLCRTRLNAGDNIFDNACAHFNRAEKETLLRYCTIANKKNPRGFGDCGLVAVLAHRCPNNTIPVLHAVHGKWSGLFPRHL